MSKLKVGIAQVRHSTDIWANTQHALNIIDRFHRAGADLVVFPECYLSGFSPELRAFDASRAQSSIEHIAGACRWYGISCFLSSAIEDEGSLLNGGYWIDPSHTPQAFYKQSLMPGEERLFTARANACRDYELNGFKVGFLICKEASDDPWSLLRKDAMPDLILWPGVWGWDRPEWGDHLEELSANVYRNQAFWRRPLIQANYAGYQVGDTRKAPSGLSVVVDASNSAKFTAAKDAEAYFLVNLERVTGEVQIRDVELI